MFGKLNNVTYGAMNEEATAWQLSDGTGTLEEHLQKKYSREEIRAWHELNQQQSELNALGQCEP